MKADASFLNGKSEQQILRYLLDENRHEPAGERNYFECLVHNVADSHLNREKKHNHFVVSNVKSFYCFCPFPQSYIDLGHPTDQNPHKNGYIFFFID
jgi:hypothetical protein